MTRILVLFVLALTLAGCPCRSGGPQPSAPHPHVGAFRIDPSTGPNFATPVAPPLAATWTAGPSNTTATAADQTLPSSVFFSTASTGAGTLVQTFGQAIPAAPFTLTAVLAPQIGLVQFAAAGIYVRDASGHKLQTFGVTYNTSQGGLAIEVDNFTTQTSFSSTPFQAFSPVRGAPLILRYQDDNTHSFWFVSTDGKNFQQLYTQTRAAWVPSGGNEIGVEIQGSNALAAALLTSWSVTQP